MSVRCSDRYRRGSTDRSVQLSPGDTVDPAWTNGYTFDAHTIDDGPVPAHWNDGGTLTFPPGTTTENVRIPLVQQQWAEPIDQTGSDSSDSSDAQGLNPPAPPAPTSLDFFVNLSVATGATIARGTGTATIIDNPAVSLSINDVTVNNTDRTATFTVSLSGPATYPVSVDWTPANGTAARPMTRAGFCGVYDVQSGKLLAYASGETKLANGAIPLNRVARYGGRRSVNTALSEILGETSANRLGFNMTMDEIVNFAVRFNSGTINTVNPNVLNPTVPASMRQQILDAITKATGREAYSAP